MAKRGYLNWREGFLDEVLNKQANLTAHEFFLDSCRRRFLSALNKNVIDNVVTRDLCELGHQHFEGRAKFRGLKALWEHGHESTLRRAQYNKMADHRMKRLWRALIVGAENSRIMKIRNAAAKELWMKSFKKRVFTGYSLMVKEVQFQKAAARVIVERKKQTLKTGFLLKWALMSDRLQLLRKIIGRKTKEDIRETQEWFIMAWKEFTKH